MSTIFSMGHSTRSIHEFVSLLNAFSVEELVDIRLMPGSRHNPQFKKSEMEVWLPERGIVYTHAKPLGGYKKPQPGSPNTAWRAVTFRGYADWLDTDEGREQVAWLEQRARDHSVAYMCSEATWWNCHRRVLSDQLLVRGWEVLHIGYSSAGVPHELPEFAVVHGTRVTYPPPIKMEKLFN